MGNWMAGVTQVPRTHEGKRQLFVYLKGYMNIEFLANEAFQDEYNIQDNRSLLRFDLDSLPTWDSL